MWNILGIFNVSLWTQHYFFMVNSWNGNCYIEKNAYYTTFHSYYQIPLQKIIEFTYSKCGMGLRAVFQWSFSERSFLLITLQIINVHFFSDSIFNSSLNRIFYWVSSNVKHNQEGEPTVHLILPWDYLIVSPTVLLATFTGQFGEK